MKIIVHQINFSAFTQLNIGLQVGLFHGGKSLCEAKRTDDLKVTVVGDQCECDINVSFEFDMLMCNIPKNVKLCFVVYEVNKSYKGGKFKKSKEANKVRNALLQNKFSQNFFVGSFIQPYSLGEHYTLRFQGSIEDRSSDIVHVDLRRRKFWR